MVELIRTKKGLDYPDSLSLRIRAFNNQLVDKHLDEASEILKIFPGSRITRCEVAQPSVEEQSQFDALCAEVHACHEAMCQPA